MLLSRPLGSLSSPYFYGTSDRFRDSLYDVDHHVSEVDRVGSLAVFLYDSDADEWTEEKDGIESVFDHHAVMFSQWELCLHDYKNFLMHDWLPRVDRFVAGLCENQLEMVPVSLRRKINRARKRVHLGPEVWPPVYLIADDDGHRVLVSSVTHDVLGRPTKL